jgi:nucleoside-diphosphate-sugar epimerase
MAIDERVIMTGSSGFVGGALAARLARPFQPLHLGAADWQDEIARADFRSATVFHLAARVHRDGDADDAGYGRDNVDKTRELARAAAAGGARRLVFLSSVKVHGEETRAHPFRPGDEPRPADAYGRSKWRAEQELAAIARSTALEVAIVRAPLVFGVGARGNLASLLRLADSGWPLPFASIRNRRSFVHVDDLARALVLCAKAPAAANATFIAAHPEPFSTARLLALLRTALGRPARLFAMPAAVLEAVAAGLGQRARMARLTRSLEVDPSDAERELGWRAEVSLEAAVEEMASAHRSGART